MATAHLLINCETGQEKSVVKELGKFNSITEIAEVFGAYDIIAKLETPNIHELKENVSSDIRKIPKIVSTVTLMDAENYDD